MELTPINNYYFGISEYQRKKNKEEKLKALCEEFESIFIYQILKQLPKLRENNSIFGNSFAMKLWESLLYEEYSKIIAKNYNFGIAENLYSYLVRNKGKDSSSE